MLRLTTFSLQLATSSDRTPLAGVDNCVVVAVSATRPRENSEVDPMEDEVELFKSMRIAGFKKQLMFQMPLIVPAEE